jgi:hypothetical protein
LDRLIQSAKDGEGGNAEWEEKDRRMRRTVQKLEQKQRSRDKNQLSGDADVEYRDPADVARRAQQRASSKMRKQQQGEEREKDRWNEDDGDDDGEDEYYKKAKKSIANLKRKRKEEYDWGEQLDAERRREGHPEEDEDDAGKRGATWQMLKNQGLKAHKKVSFFLISFCIIGSSLNFTL